MRLEYRKCVLGAIMSGLVLGAVPWAAADDRPAAPDRGSALAPAQQPDRNAPRPIVDVAPAVFDFGTVWEGADAKGEITVTNKGNAPLTLKTRSSCGCTVAGRPKSPLEPGESTSFKISYSTNRRGEANKKVYLETNDPLNSRVIIPVKGTVKAVLECDPSDRIMFQNMETTSAAERVVTLTSQVDEPIKLALKPGQKFDRFDVQLVELEPGKKFELRVKTVPPLAVGHTRERIELSTGVESVPDYRLWLQSHVPPRVALRPARMYVFSNLSQRREQMLFVEYQADQPLHITEVKTDVPGLEFEVLPADEETADAHRAAHRIRVKLPEFEQMTADRGALEILTDDPTPEYRKLVVPVIKRDIQRAQRGPQARVPAARETSGPKSEPAGRAANSAGEREPMSAEAAELRARIEEAIRKAQEQRESEEANQQEAEQAKGNAAAE